jgi:hypothetical protein
MYRYHTIDGDIEFSPDTEKKEIFFSVIRGKYEVRERFHFRMRMDEAVRFANMMKHTIKNG